MGRLDPASATSSRLLAHYSRPFIRNAWYCAAWSSEVGEPLLARRILDDPLLLYRAADGQPVALLDVCPHKLAPMHLGRRAGDGDIVCGYHGLRFDRHGACVHNPQGNGQIPASARLKSYPLLERYGALWVWMGDAERADPASLPDFSHIDDAGRWTVRGSHQVACNYLVMVENLMDLGHVMFLHGQSAGTGGVQLSANKTGVKASTVFDQRLYENVPVPAAFRRLYGEGERVDFWTDIRWDAPALIRNHAGAAPLGKARGAESTDQFGSHFLTPETSRTTHYFYAHSRNYALADPVEDEFYRQWQRTALRDEDSMVAEAIQGFIPQAQRLGVEMVVLSTDLSGIRVNRILDRMAAAEDAG